ncbi:MAG TPA: chromate transporter, partial [Longimicrobiales bacterium]|nr:chromate transporter [Longimicrobiales bacterium]
VYLVTVVGAPYFERVAERPALSSLVTGLAAAAAGALAGAALILAQRALVDSLSVVLAVASFVLASVFPKLPEPALILSFAAVGILVA